MFQEVVSEHRERQSWRKEGFTGMPDRFIQQDIWHKGAVALEQGLTGNRMVVMLNAMGPFRS